MDNVAAPPRTLAGMSWVELGPLLIPEYFRPT